MARVHLEALRVISANRSSTDAQGAKAPASAHIAGVSVHVSATRSAGMRLMGAMSRSGTAGQAQVRGARNPGLADRWREGLAPRRRSDCAGHRYKPFQPFMVQRLSVLEFRTCQSSCARPGSAGSTRITAQSGATIGLRSSSRCPNQIPTSTGSV